MNKICFIDLETSPNISYTWYGKFEVDVVDFIEEGYILSFAYKFLGDKKVKAYSLADFKMDKKKLVKKLWEVFDESDIIVAHNAKQFDVKWANRAFVLYGFTPPSPYKVVDTLTESRSKFKFNSNRLNDLGKYLGIGTKVETGGFPLWKKCMAGDKKAFKKMVEYNKNDIVLLEKVYLKLRPYMTTHPSTNTDDNMVCPMCGSRDLIKRGFRFTTTMKNQRWVCKDCGKWSVGSGYRYLSKENKLT
jgi:DNA polymerase III epsilon subunit-like protein